MNPLLFDVMQSAGSDSYKQQFEHIESEPRFYAASLLLDITNKEFWESNFATQLSSLHSVKQHDMFYLEERQVEIDVRRCVAEQLLEIAETYPGLELEKAYQSIVQHLHVNHKFMGAFNSVGLEHYEVAGTQDNLLHLSARHGKIELAEFLIRYSFCDKDATNVEGMTPLMVACRFCNYEIGEQLIEFGADLNIENPCSNLTFLASFFVESHLDLGALMNFFDKVDPLEFPRHIPTLRAVIAHFAPYNKPEICVGIVRCILRTKSASEISFEYVLGDILQKYFYHSKAKSDLRELFKVARLETVFVNTYEIVQRKILAHSWKVQGEFSMCDQKFEYNGYNQKAMICLFQEWLNILLPVRLVRVTRCSLPDYNGDNSFCEIVAKTYDSFSHGKPIVIPTGWTGHSVSVVIYKCQLVVCDLGDIDKVNLEGGIKLFEIKGKITKEYIESLLRNNNKESFQEILHAVELCDIGTLPIKGQRGGFCSFDSLKAAVFSVIYLLRSNDSKLANKELIGESKSIYKEFIGCVNARVLEEYLEDTSTPDLSALNEVTFRMGHKVKKMSYPVDQIEWLEELKVKVRELTVELYEKHRNEWKEGAQDNSMANDLYRIAFTNRWDIARDIEPYISDYNIPDNGGCTLAMWAIRSRNPEEAERFLETGKVDCDACDVDGNTLLGYVLWYGYKELAIRLIQSAADVNQFFLQKNRVSLHLVSKVVSRGWLDVLSVMLDNGLIGSNCLVHAIALDPTEATKLILERGEFSEEYEIKRNFSDDELKEINNCFQSKMDKEMLFHLRSIEDYS